MRLEAKKLELEGVNTQDGNMGAGGDGPQMMLGAGDNGLVGPRRMSHLNLRHFDEDDEIVPLKSPLDGPNSSETGDIFELAMAIGTNRRDSQQSLSITEIRRGSAASGKDMQDMKAKMPSAIIGNRKESHLHHGVVKMPIKVSNVTTNQQLTDTLYQQSKPIACSNHVCVGAKMDGQSKDDPTTCRGPEEILEQSLEFMEQYFIHSQKHADKESLKYRLSEIAAELEKTGTYTLTTDEIHFGAKTAWRNAARCIGRIQWNRLEIQDARYVKTTQEMFDALCRHIEFATNGGNLRSMITVFPQRVPGREDFRLWNPQLIGYAGYVQPDGSVIGDPGRVQFTRVCQRLGWKGKGGRFDILPLVLSAPDEGPKVYEIPERLILRVPLEHPELAWFAELGLEWYALPAVADMQFDCGGLQFTAAPFNGWYMGTEIGARDLCDPQRYNITEEIAVRLGLDTNNPTNLWKDRVLVEVNRAVLYSYQKAGVTIVDHHTASESFIKHMQTEYKVRGGCPADWVWVVPPMSASLCPVFHQEMINYHLKPSYEYQVPAWKTYKWATNVELKYRFSSVAKAVLWTNFLMAKVAAKRVKATILFATETGRSESFAQKLARLMHSSFCVQVQNMQDYDVPKRLPNESLVLIVTSTFGNGEAPDNGKDFWKKLYTLRHESLIRLSDVKYAVFALGSSQYPTFCSFGKNVDKILGELGATQVLPVGLGDELRGQEQTFSNWAQDCYRKSCKQFKLDIDENELNTVSNNFTSEGLYNPDRVRLKEIANETSPEDEHVVQELARMHRKKVMPLKVVSRTRLQPRQSPRQTLLVRLTPANPLAKSSFDYEPGDHLGVFPQNPPEVIDALLGHIRRTGYENVDTAIVQIELLGSDGRWKASPKLPPCTLRTAFTSYLDITTPPSQSILKYLAEMANDNWDSYRLKKLAADVDDYEKWRSFNRPTMGDVLKEFPSVHVDPEFLLTQLPLLQPRYYSISSSRKVKPREVHLTMSLVCYNIHDGKGPKRYGVCTSFFDRFPQNDVPCFFRPAPQFHLPEDPSVPIIMIGAGSGIAPFRSFWQEREATQLKPDEKYGKMILFFGCRQEKMDNIYGEELNGLLRKGVLHEVFLALSREPNMKKFSVRDEINPLKLASKAVVILKRLCGIYQQYTVNEDVQIHRYVQDQVFKQRVLVHWLLFKEHGHIYVCGDAVMADGVRKTMIKVIESEAKCKSTEEAEQILNRLLQENRYHEDVFGAIHSK